MKPVAIFKTLLAAALSLVILVLGSTAGRTASNPQPTVTIASISGFAGHAFVYAEVSEGAGVYPAPAGTTYQSPYYAQWLPLPVTEPGCRSVWGVYVIDRATNTQINRPSDPSPRNFGTANRVCVTSTTTPVGQPPNAEAAARLDLDLTVTVTPSVAQVGSASLITAGLSSTVTEDLNAEMNMAIEDWRVTSWFVDYGDGQSATMPGGGIGLEAPHHYQSAGQYDARVVASISGHAQAAVYGGDGWPDLIQQGFAVDIGNDALATAHLRSIRRYLPPDAEVAVTPSLFPTLPDSSLGGFRAISAARGRLTLLAVHLVMTREAALTLNGRLAGFAHSTLIAWRLDSMSAAGLASTATAAGLIHPAADLLMLQWDSPDPVQHGQAEPYTVPITLFLQSHFPDGHLVTYTIASSFSVSVNFAAESG